MPVSKKSTKRRTSTQTKKTRAAKLVKAAASRARHSRGAPSPSPGNRTAPRRPVAKSYGIRESSKLGTVITMLHRKDGATIEAMCKATGWQSHSVRGALSGTVRKKLGLDVQSMKTDGIRIYRIID